MYNINDTLADGSIAYAVNLKRYSAGAEREVRRHLRKLERSIVESLESIDVSGVVRSKYRQQRLTVLLKEVQQSLGVTYTGLRSYADNEMLELVSVSSMSARELVNSSIGYNLATSGLSSELLASISSNVLIAGAPSREWWSRQRVKTMSKFKDQVRLGMSQGESTSEIVKRIRGTATGRRFGYKLKSGAQRFHAEFKGGILDVATRDAEALVITSIQTVANDARMAMYKANSDVIRGVQALATLDNRTTQICMSRSGNSWTLDGNPMHGTTENFPGAPPWHWRCRSTLSPILPSFEDLAGNISAKKRALLRKNVSKSTQASMNGQVASKLTYEQWLKIQPKDFQKEVLGPGKYKLWKDEKLGFSDMVDQKGNPLTLKALGSNL